MRVTKAIMGVRPVDKIGSGFECCAADAMRAVTLDKYGPPEVLRLDEVPRPVPGAAEILVEVYATTVTRTDCHLRRADPFVWRLVAGLRRPRRRVLGSEFAGRVEVVGNAVSEFAPGDEVFGITGLAFGAHAEYVCVRENSAVVHKPTSVSFEQSAAVLDGALDALAKLRRLRLRQGQSILVYGASGSIGTAAVQLAKSMGATVTAVCGTKDLALIRSLGADRVIDYTLDDFANSGETYDVIFDAVGKQSFGRCRRSLRAGGLYTAVDGWSNVLWLLATRVARKKRVVFAPPRQTKANALYLRSLLETGKYQPVIDRTYRLADVVEASRYVETGQKTGNVVITVGTDRTTGEPSRASDSLEISCV